MSAARLQLGRLRWAFGLAFGVLAIGLFFLSTYFGSVVFCIWLFVLGRWVLQTQSEPFAFPIRIGCTAAILQGAQGSPRW